MFMSCNMGFPRTHWEVLAPAMRKQAAIHERIAGHVPRGPFKHFWGEHSRWVGDADPYSLFLAVGVPFEVVETLDTGGHVFLADADSDSGAIGIGSDHPTKAVLIRRPDVTSASEQAQVIPETLEALFALKHSLMPGWRDIPHVLEDIPIVCAWYPSASAAVLWNLTESPQTVTLQCGPYLHALKLAPLDAELVEI